MVFVVYLSSDILTFKSKEIRSIITLSGTQGDSPQIRRVQTKHSCGIPSPSTFVNYATGQRESKHGSSIKRTAPDECSEEVELMLPLPSECHAARWVPAQPEHHVLVNNRTISKSERNQTLSAGPILVSL